MRVRAAPACRGPRAGRASVCRPVARAWGLCHGVVDLWDLWTWGIGARADEHVRMTCKIRRSPPPSTLYGQDPRATGRG